jgi:hypothetical protein
MDYLETCFMCESEFEVGQAVVLVQNGTVHALFDLEEDKTTEFEEEHYRGIYCVECYGKILQEIHKLYKGGE